MTTRYGIFFRKHWDAGLAAVTACIFIYLFTRRGGIGVSPDSVSYLSAATNISQHFSFTDFNGLPLIDFPRGYPSFLALMARLSYTPVFQLMPLINAVLFSLAIFLSSCIISGYRDMPPLYKSAILLVLAFSPALLEIYSMIWSETLFIVLCLAFLITAKRYLVSHKFSSLVWMSLVASLAFVTRYAGICVIAAGTGLLLFDGYPSWKKKLGHLIFFICAGSLLAGLNIVFNHRASASLTGVREKAIRTVADNIAQIAGVIGDWLPFLHGHITAAVIVLLVLFTVAAFSFLYRVLQQQYYASYETVVNCFFVVYIVFIVTVASLSRFEDLSNRLLSPAYIPLLLVATAWLPRMLRKQRFALRIVLLVTATTIYAVLLYQQYRLNAENWEGIRDAGIPGYTENSWKNAPTVKYLQQHKDSLSAVLYSDANDAAYFLAGLHAAALPHKEIQAEIDMLLSKPLFTVIWFDDGFNPDLIGIDLIKQHKKLLWVKSFEGGAIYQFADSAR